MKPIVLASQSPRRRMLLEWAEIPFETIVKGTDETYPNHLSKPEIAIHIAKEKAKAVKNYVHEAFHVQYKNQPILAADTIVVIDDDIIGKPATREEAIDTIMRLQGRKHIVITGVVILFQGHEIAFADTTEVSFHPLNENQAAYYVDKYEPYDKAGSYAIQEWIGVIGIASIKGDFYNVMGLPISKVVQKLDELDY